MTGQPVDDPDLEEGGEDEVEAILLGPDPRGLGLDGALLVQQVAEHDAAGPARDAVRDHPAREGFGVRPRHLDLGEGGNIHDSDALAHRLHLVRHHVVPPGPAERVDIAGGKTVAGEPARAFPAGHLLLHRSGRLQAPVERARLHRAAREPVEVRPGDLVAQQVVLACLGHRVVPAGEVAVAARVELAHRDLRRSVHHPLREVPARSRPPCDADLGPAAAPVVGEPGSGAEQHVAVGRVGDGAVDGALDPELGQNRHPFHGVLEPRHDAVVVGGEQLALRLPRRPVQPDGVGVRLLVDADESRFLLHADVAGDLGVVAHHRELAGEVDELRHRLGDEVVVGHAGDGQVQPRPLSDLACVRASGVHDVLANVLALLGDHPPLAVRLRPDAGDAVVAHDRRALLPGARGQREGPHRPGRRDRLPASTAPP